MTAIRKIAVTVGGTTALLLVGTVFGLQNKKDLPYNWIWGVGLTASISAVAFYHHEELVSFLERYLVSINKSLPSSSKVDPEHLANAIAEQVVMTPVGEGRSQAVADGAAIIRSLNNLASEAPVWATAETIVEAPSRVTALPAARGEELVIEPPVLAEEPNQALQLTTPPLPPASTKEAAPEDEDVWADNKPNPFRPAVRVG